MGLRKSLPWRLSRLSECFIVAELGSNWLSYQGILDSIKAAKSAGDNAIKLQLFNHYNLYGYVDKDIADRYGRITMLYELFPDWLPDIKLACDKAGIEFMCTLFDPEDVRKFDHLVNRHKVASSDLSYPQLLKAIAATRKPVILSTGAATLDEVTQALSYFPSEKTTVLYCNSSYPSLDHDLRVLEDLDEHFYPVAVGYSDHSIDICSAVEAVDRGATVIEKHFNPLNLKDTPDAPHSIGTALFKEMVDRIRGKPHTFGPSPSEAHMLLRNKRRLIAIKDISPGEVLSYGLNFGCYRSLVDAPNGISGFKWQDFNGHVASDTIKAGTSLKPEDALP